MRTNISELTKGMEAVIGGIITKTAKTKMGTNEPWILLKIAEVGKGFASAQIWSNLDIYPVIEQLEDGCEVEAEVVCTEVGQYINIEIKSIHVFVRKEVSIVNIQKLQTELRNFIKEMKDLHLKKLICDVLGRPDMKEAYWEAPVTMTSGFCFKGGVLAKAVREIRLVKAISHVFNEWDMFEDNVATRLNEEFLSTLCILDPIGKVKSYQWNGLKVVKTKEGELFEESLLTAKVVWEELLKSELPEEQRIILEHVLGASKGRQEHGALHISRSREADAFQYISKMNFSGGQFEFLDRHASATDEFLMLFDRKRMFLGVYDA
jgi:3'-5' exoribonuclease